VATTAQITPPNVVSDDDAEFTQKLDDDNVVESPASRWWLAGAFAVALASVIPEAFGRQFVDTKLDLTTSPVSFLTHLLNLWDPNGWFGYLQDQYVGYAFPTAPLFALGHLLLVPAWITERVWIALFVTAGFWGAVRLAEALEIGSLPTRLIGGLAYTLWPTFTFLAGTHTAAIAPGELLPWVMIPLVKGCKGGSTLRAAALSALAVLFIGGVNAADTIDVLIVPVLYLLTRQPSPRQRSLFGWWIVCVALATMWWVIPLLLLGKYGFNFLPFTEQSVTTTSTMSAAAALQGTGDWVGYVSIGSQAWDTAAATLVTLPAAIIGTSSIAAIGLFGLARRDLRERRFLLLVFAAAVVLAMTAYWGPLGGPFGHLLRPLLDGALSPFRNVYKFEPLLALPMALGIMHTLHVVRPHFHRNLSVGHILSITVVSVLTVGGLLSLASPYAFGRVSTPNSFPSVPGYWFQTADYLTQHAPRTTALVVPASAHGLYTWGWTIDEPLEALAQSPWVDREIVPYGGAGSTRVIDAIDQALRTGLPQPGLTSLLTRSGISYVVVQNDVESQLSDSPSPYTINRVLSEAGLFVVASFGPAIETYVQDNPTLRPVHSGFEVSYPTIQIFKVHGNVRPVQSFPTSTAALVTGGPESELQLFNQGVISTNQAVVLAANWKGSHYTGPLLAVTDTLRRENDTFGLVNDNYSFTLTPNQLVQPNAASPDGPQPPRQMLPFQGVQHQTVAKYVGAASVNASSYGSWILSLPEYNPANVFDNDTSIGWTAGSPIGSVGQWIDIRFNEPRSLRDTRISLLTSGNRPIATEVQVSTNQGSVFDRLKPTDQVQKLRAPEGKATWLKVTFVRLVGQVAGGGDAGIRHISVPGLDVQPYLKPPQEAVGASAEATVFSFETVQVDPTAILRSAPEPVMARIFSTTKPTRMTITGTAQPVTGGALNALLSTSTLHVSASSTFDNLPSLRPQNLFTGQTQTNWIAGSSKATLSLSWPKAAVLQQLDVVFSGATVAARPEEILLKSPKGDRLLHLNVSGSSDLVNFEPLVTRELQISFPKVQSRETSNSFGGLSPTPVGLAELKFPALEAYETGPPNPKTTFARLCGAGPPISIDGHTYATFVWGTYGQIYNLQPLRFEVCQPGQSTTVFTPLSVSLAKGSHRLIAIPSTKSVSPFMVTGLKMSTAPAPTTPTQQVRAVSVLKWGSENREILIGPGTRSYLELHQNFNSGWVATLNGQTLRPIVLDGWQQGYVVPAGSHGVATLTFQPETIYLGALFVSGLGVLLLILLLVLCLTRVTRFGAWGSETAEAPPWTGVIPNWLLVVACALVILSVGGPVVLAVPILVIVARLRPRLLPWIALTGMIAAGFVSAWHIGNGAQSGIGAYGPWAQLAALLSIAAVLTSLVFDRPHGHEISQREGCELAEPSPTSGGTSLAVDSPEMSS
jgi:arabinofuranan 3-O-arabinosyltransferase